MVVRVTDIFTQCFQSQVEFRPLFLSWDLVWLLHIMTKVRVEIKICEPTVRREGPVPTIRIV